MLKSFKEGIICLGQTESHLLSHCSSDLRTYPMTKPTVIYGLFLSKVPMLYGLALAACNMQGMEGSAPL